MSARRLVILFALALAGCVESGGLTLSAPDQIAQPGKAVQVEATIHRKGWSKWFPPHNPPSVRVYREEELLAEFFPGGGKWSFSTTVPLETVGEHAIDAIYQRRAENNPTQATCYAYCWDASRVAIVVDLDRVVNQNTRMDRVMGDRPLGDVREDAGEFLTLLSKQFFICYVTTLSGELKEDARRWMRTNGLPTGPIFTWDRGKRYRFRHGNQADTLAGLQRQVPTLLIGIGDGADDLEAFSRNKMLPVMITYGGSLRTPQDVPQFAGWAAAYQLFTMPANQSILTDPVQMLDLFHRGGNYVGAGDPGEPPK
ncbi:MAG: hypothetical protein PHU85_09290 [Phycisphaerae bacterium]|nr:hypothetical protein [Phycisphaerae bacterium]